LLPLARLRPPRLRSSHTLLLAIALWGCASASEARPGPAPRARHLVVVGINDTHGALLPVRAPRALEAHTEDEIGGAAWMAGWLTAIRSEEQKRGGEVIVLDGGDAFQGTLISNAVRGRSVFDAYNAMGVAAAAVGNQEFDFGIQVLRERMAQAKFPFLAANVFRKGTRERPDWARPSSRSGPPRSIFLTSCCARARIRRSRRCLSSRAWKRPAR